MVESERAMILETDSSMETSGDRFTSLQPGYEDSVPPDPDDWDEDQ